MLAAADDLPIAGDVLELACGTGQWTPLLAARARQFRVVKVFHDPRTLTRDLTALGWSVRFRPGQGNAIVSIAEPPANP